MEKGSRFPMDDWDSNNQHPPSIVSECLVLFSPVVLIFLAHICYTSGDPFLGYLLQSVRSASKTTSAIQRHKADSSDVTARCRPIYLPRPLSP